MQTVRTDKVLAQPKAKFPRLMLDSRDEMIVMVTGFCDSDRDMYQSIIMDLGNCCIPSFQVGDAFNANNQYMSDYAGSVTLTND